MIDAPPEWLKRELDMAYQRGRREGREECAKMVADFSWQLPLYKEATLNEVSDDAAEAVREQIEAVLRSLSQEGG